MADVATTKMSSKGQVVIPEQIRKRLNLREGSQFVVVGEKDMVILKAISAPARENFKELIGTARKQARQAGMGRSDITRAVSQVRRKREDRS